MMRFLPVVVWMILGMGYSFAQEINTEICSGGIKLIVVDAETGAPIPDVYVSTVATNAGGRTDANGKLVFAEEKRINMDTLYSIGKYKYFDEIIKLGCSPGPIKLTQIKKYPELEDDYLYGFDLKILDTIEADLDALIWIDGTAVSDKRAYIDYDDDNNNKKMEVFNVRIPASYVQGKSVEKTLTMCDVFANRDTEIGRDVDNFLRDYEPLKAPIQDMFFSPGSVSEGIEYRYPVQWRSKCKEDPRKFSQRTIVIPIGFIFAVSGDLDDHKAEHVETFIVDLADFDSQSVQSIEFLV
ncbi:MAG: hypothetical protein R3A45_11360 [Bdellovibrionota bacterium]